MRSARRTGSRDHDVLGDDLAGVGEQRPRARARSRARARCPATVRAALLERGAASTRAAGLRARDVRENVLGEQRDVLARVAQRRHASGYDLRAGSRDPRGTGRRATLGLEVAVGRGDERGRRPARGLGRADALDLAVLEHAQELGLHRRAACRRSRRGTACRRRATRTGRARARRAPVNAPRSWPNSSLSSSVSGIAAQLIATNGARRARAAVVERARDELLADAALARDEHRRRRGRDADRARGADRAPACCCR